MNVALLMRNIIWQLRERIINKQRKPLQELIRTFWYMHIKPTLSRAGALSVTTDQYDQLIEQLVVMVKDYDVIDYKEIGFRDEKAANRIVGANATIILAAEKEGHQPFLVDINHKYQINTMALGDQLSVFNIEYFVNGIKQQEVNLQRSCYIFIMVDYNPCG